MICSRCEANIPDSTTFCVRCGVLNPGAAPLPGQASGEGPPLRVASYLVWSIFSVLCFFPPGIAAIIFSVNCKSDLAAGRYDSATDHSNIAFYCNVLGLVFCVICFALLLWLSAGSAAQGPRRCC